MDKNNKRGCNKKGATTQTIIVSIIILLISGGIIFYFFNLLPYKDIIDKQACHQSVLLRSQAIAGLKPGQFLEVSLNCKTQKIEISETNEERIKREIANQMYDCWWMLGEGKLDFFSSNKWRSAGVPGLGTAETACVICSTISFSEKLKENPKEIQILTYLEKTKIPNKNLTYLDYFAGQENTKLPAALKVEGITTDKDYAIIFMGIRGGSWGEFLRGVGAGATIGGVVGFRLGGLKGAAIGAGILGGLQAIMQPITQFTSSHAAAIHCEGEEQGCMMLMLIPLEAENLKEVCQNIESTA